MISSTLYLLHMTELKYKSLTFSKKFNQPLNWLQVQVIFLSGNIVGSHNAYFQPSGDTARKHTSKGIEATLVRGGDHL